MSRIRITISGDGLTAEAAVTPGPSAPAAELASLMQAQGVQFGLQQEVIDAMGVRLGDPNFEGRSVVAVGQRATDGEDGHVVIEVPTEVIAGRHGDHDSIDFRERDFLHPVQGDQRIGEIVAPTAGEPGTSVRGAALPARPGREHRLRLGAGVRVTDGVMFATHGGVLCHDARQLDVVPLFTHSGDVDYRSGNLRSEGSLAVRGDVQAGFTVEASNDVQIAGAVLDGTVNAGGSVQIDQGVIGPASRVQAGAMLSCRHATGATLQAGQVMTIADQAVHCRLRADSLLMLQGRATIIGGEARARSSIVVGDAGTAVGAPTWLVVGDVVDASAEVLKATLADQKLGARAQLRGRGNERSGGGGKLLRQAVRLQEPAQQETLRLRQRQRELLLTARVEVTGTLHPGVRVAFGEQERHFTESRSHVCLRWDPTENKIIEENLP